MKNYYEMGIRPAQRSGTVHEENLSMSGRTGALNPEAERREIARLEKMKSMQSTGGGIREDAPKTLPLNMPVVSNANRTEVFVSSPIDLNEAISVTLNIADDSMKELLLRTKGMFTNTPDPEIKRYDPERLQTAALCGRSIAEIMKVKVDALRLLKEK